MSFIKKLWNVVRGPIRYVGRDLEGNTFYETKSLNDPDATKRTVKYADSEDVWKYIGGGKRLPIQWSAWLTHTRKHPPTIQELHADIARQQRVSANVALIEARDRAEAEQMLLARQRGAQQALEDADLAARGNILPHPETIPQNKPTSRNDSVEAKEHYNIKVLPPTFLTPSTPRKTKSSQPFSVPNLTELEDDAQSKTQAGPKSKDASPSPWHSKAVPETESWAPKARSRG